MKWMCRNTFAALFKPYERKAWFGDVPMREAFAKCACYGVREGGRWVYAMAVQIKATTAHIWAAVGTSGDNWKARTEHAAKQVCSGHMVTFATIRPGIVKALTDWESQAMPGPFWIMRRAF